MKLSRNAIDEFKKIYRAELGKDLTDQEAYEKGLQLLSLFKSIYRPISKRSLVHQKVQNNYEAAEWVQTNT